jgi:hypothetical protein
MSRVSIKYAKEVYKLNVIKEKPFSSLEALEEKSKVDMEEELLICLRKTTAKKLDNLPEEIIRLILEFADANTLLNILKNGGFFQKIEKALQLVPDTPIATKQYYSCLEILEPIVYKYWSRIALEAKKIKSIWHENSFEDYIHKTQTQSESRRITHNYMKNIIIVGVTEYTIMYKREQDPSVILENEKRFLQVNILFHTLFMTKK